MMNTLDTIKYWVEMSDYDLETARAMLKTGRFLYVGFMSHQAVEKILKAYSWKISGLTPPYTHDLWKLIRSSDITDRLQENFADLIDELQPLNYRSPLSKK